MTKMTERNDWFWTKLIRRQTERYAKGQQSNKATTLPFKFKILGFKLYTYHGT